MKVVLTQDVLKLGKAGDIKLVRDGYGRNYLVPQGLAVLATPGAIKQAEDIKKRALRHREGKTAEFTSLAARIGDVSLTFNAKAGETGRLYGSITSAAVADRLSERLGTEVDRRKLDMAPLRELGQHRVTVYLASDIAATFTVNVLGEGETLRTARPAPAAEPAAEPVAEIAESGENNGDETVGQPAVEESPA